MKFHHFDTDISKIELPTLFTYPFHYVPHTLAAIAAKQTQSYIASHSDKTTGLQAGKMLGVLVAASPCGEIGFFAAYSGNLNGSNHHEYFVPPVYDLLKPDGFFRTEEDNISHINQRIDNIASCDEYISLKSKLDAQQLDAQKEISCYRTMMQQSKAARDAARKLHSTDNDSLIRESQFQKAELKRIQAKWKNAIDSTLSDIRLIEQNINSLKEERRSRSAALQTRLFEHFVMLNARGKRRNLCDIFASTPQRTPPAGAGECAAPKLLQYAFSFNYKPLAMAEFWYGKSPKSEVRIAGNFYPACISKCRPILQFMLQGLDVEPSSLDNVCNDSNAIDIVYDDDYLLIVDKPANMLTVPGKISNVSLLSHVQRLYPSASGPMIVHRLDMATSGLVIIAKSKGVHKALQHQFASRQVKKTYIALLNGNVTTDSGTIELPLCLNVHHRPQQMVDFENGKAAITTYEVMERRNDNTTLVHFHPVTGRTHQLRVHSAHPLGLNAPIVGDTLYGSRAARLCLHAASVTFKHPITGKEITIVRDINF